MDKTSSHSLKKLLNPSALVPCKACGLYLNQAPILDSEKRSQIFWVGLSAVQFDDDEEKLPLSPNTRTGALIEEIEKSYTKTVVFYKTNVVKCLPLKGEKIRYPLESEMEKCFPNFEIELKMFKPKVAFLLGKQVATFVYKKFELGTCELSDDFQYETVFHKHTLFVPIHHPSYILVYKRKFLNQYIDSVRNHFNMAQADQVLI